MLLVTFEQMISNPLCIFAIIFAAFGMATILLAKKITKVVRKTETVDESDKLLRNLKLIGIGLVLLAFVFLFIWGMDAI